MPAGADVEDAEVVGSGLAADGGVLTLEGDVLGDHREAVAVLVASQGVGAALGQLQHAAVLVVGERDRLDQLVGVARDLLGAVLLVVLAVLPSAVLAVLAGPVVEAAPVVAAPLVVLTAVVLGAALVRAAVVADVLPVGRRLRVRHLVGLRLVVPSGDAAEGRQADHAGQPGHAGDPERPPSPCRRSCRGPAVGTRYVVGHQSLPPFPATRRDRTARGATTSYKWVVASDPHRMRTIFAMRTYPRNHAFGAGQVTAANRSGPAERARAAQTPNGAGPLGGSRRNPWPPALNEGAGGQGWAGQGRGLSPPRPRRTVRLSRAGGGRPRAGRPARSPPRRRCAAGRPRG